MRRRPLLVGIAVALAGLGLVVGLIGLVGRPGPPAPDGTPAASAGPGAADPVAGTARPTAPPGRPQTPSSESRQRPASGSPPVGLEVPAIGVSTPVNTVGLNPDGTLEVPAPGPQYDQAAWYRGSPTPGRLGPSVILGHVDSAADGPSVFFELGRLRPGDMITVTLADRSARTFAVDNVRRFPKDAFPRLEVYGDTPGPELRLITCGGPFDSAVRSYEDNTVVFAHVVP
ncbi:class F sortase [Actinomycetospora sp. NBRC 106375]|uniref:class F sortase n=1 Tax=Actinomycetospora sp. NBRC 106375 TaxID=3032207 RepID=UPI0024A52872|nr:class F sortase [Actinomycetospora sp. NBRC 106375]GLZ48976.1 class F sortase [Actinomycetospora sp. NBRC 106375]